MKKAKLVLAVAALATTVVSVVGLTTSTQTKAAGVSSTVNIYRLYNPNTGEHFYTSGIGERNVLLTKGWQYEGIGWTEATTGKPVYRLYNPNAKGGDHYYTMDLSEKNGLVAQGWKYDGVFWNASGSVPVMVAYNPNAKSGAHNYTTAAGEQASLLSKGWKYGQTAWMATGPGQQANPVSQVLSTNFPDPSVLHVGNSYYMYGTGSKVPMAVSSTGSTFSVVGSAKPARPAFGDANNALETAPEAAYINGRYVLYYDEVVNGQYVIAASTSDSPAGPFTPTSQPVVQTSGVMTGSAFDPNIFIDNGKVYMAYVSNWTSHSLHYQIYITQLSADGLSVVGAPQLLVDQSHIKAANGQISSVVESPAISRAADGTYVLFFAAGDSQGATGNGYSTKWATASSIMGPYTDQGVFLSTANTGTGGPGEASVLDNGKGNVMYWNGWTGEHNGFNIISGGRYVYKTAFTWVNGHTPKMIATPTD